MHKHIIPTLGHLRLSAITRNHITDFRNALKVKTHGKARKQYSPASVNTVLILLRSILSKAVQREALAAVPAFPDRLKVLPVMNELSGEEEAAFLGAFDDEPGFLRYYADPKFRGSFTPQHLAVLYSWFRASKPLFVVALHTGLRRGDLLNLQWSCVDLKAKQIRLATGKTSLAVTIPLSPSAFAALQECRSRKMASTVWVFTQQDGNRMSLTTLRRHFELAKSLAGISRRFRVHDLRHTAGSKMSSAGVSLQIISKVLGHSTARMSERYARPDEAAVAGITSAMERQR